MENKPNSKVPVTPVLFAIIVLFFFGNFFTISCGGQKVAGVSGFNLVTGTKIEASKNSRRGSGEKIPANIWAIIGFGAAIAGGAISYFSKHEKRDKQAAIVAAVGLVSHVILIFSVSNSVNKKGGGAITAEVQLSYLIVLILFAVVAWLCYKKSKQALEPPAVTD
jgi:hypothetical protein